MKRLSWAGLGTLAAAVALGCGSDKSHGHEEQDGGGGADARADSGAGGTTGAGGSDASTGAGGAPPAGGSDAGVDAAPLPVDTTAPTFGGAVTVDTTLGEDRVRVTWTAATDDLTDPPQIGYRIYRAAASHSQDFTRSHRCGDPVPDAGPVDQADAPCYVTAGSGTTSFIVRGAIPAHAFYYVVRAVDAAGNEDGNTQEVSASTPDTTAPDFGGVRAVSVVSATSIQVDWGPGYDLATSAPELVFRVYVSDTGVPNPASDTPKYVSKPGEHTTVITGLTQRTTYTVMVLAVDPSLNVDPDKRTLGITTPEGIAPTFDGAKRASAEGTTIRIFWPLATDNGTIPENIVYDVYESLVSHKQVFTKPPSYTSAPGAASIAVPDLELATRYYYVVRARDSAGNQDGNIKEVQATTGGFPDTTPPTFSGVQGLTSPTPTSLHATWLAGGDDTSLAADLTYSVYVSTTATVPLTTPAVVVRGATTAELVGLNPSTQYNVVVVATDAAGNDSAAPTTLGKATLAALPPTGDGGPDSLPPVLGGPPVAVAVVNPATRVSVSWPGATDDSYGAADIRYHVCLSTLQADCAGQGFRAHLAATTPFGTTSATVSFLLPRTPYFISVQAEDRAGNLETTAHPAQVVTSTSWTSNVKPILFNRCISCHDYDKTTTMVNVGGSYLDDTNEACLPNPPPVDGCQLKLIDPGRPEFSLIYRRVNVRDSAIPPFTTTIRNQYNGLQEPRDTTTRLSGEEDDTLRDWIEQGAVAN